MESDARGYRMLESAVASRHNGNGKDRLEGASPVSLGVLRPGDRGRVVACLGEGAVFQRLCEMGFVSGADVRVVRFAPLGDPMEVVIQNYHLSLRRREAGMVLVERSQPA